MYTHFFSVALATVLVTVAAVGQDSPPAKKPVGRKPKVQKPSADSGQKPAKPGEKPAKGKYPPLEQRLAAYREQLEQKKISREDSRPYVIELVEVAGISDAGEGYYAFVKAEDGTTLILHPGMRFYDGVVEKIEADRIIFRMTATKKTVEKKYGQSIDAQTGNP